MAFIQIENVAIKGFSACVPKVYEENKYSSVFNSVTEAEKFTLTTGVSQRRISASDVTSSDLCFHAAEKLINDLSWNKSEIDCLIFVTQTPDFILPATSCILQDRLNLPKECLALDISLGCSGWIYGLSAITSLMSQGSIKKGLLLAGDTISKILSDKDKSAYPLFGDAGTATALEYTLEEPDIRFHLATDGSGYDTIIVPDGGMRSPLNENSTIAVTIDNNIRNRAQLSLNGMDVFSFGISKAPQSVENLLRHFSIDIESIDYFVFHQANLFMNEKIRKKLKLPPEKVPYSLNKYGNTSCATIPLTMVTELQDKLTTQSMSIIGSGFGVGLSWGSVFFKTDKIVCPDLIEI